MTKAVPYGKASAFLAVVLAASGLVALAMLMRGAAPDGATAASHREAPLISLDPAADITDFFMFRSYESGKSDRVVLMMDVNPGEEPSSGPNYYGFDPNVVYSFHIDNDRDGKADDIRFDFRFDTEIRGLVKDLKLPLSYVGGLGPIPAITALDSPGLGLRQSYSVTMATRGGKRGGDDDDDHGRRGTKLAENLIAVPSNVGPRTTPNYEANLASKGVNSIAGGQVRVFAGQRDDPFYIDLGAVFDSLNLRSLGSTGGVDMLSGFNVHTIALEVPMSMISGGSSVIGAYASTSRPRASVYGDDDDDDRGRGRYAQVQRLANPLVNEVIIGTVDKDRWNATEPEDESRFLDYYLKPRVGLALQLASGVNTGCVLPLAGCTPQPPAAAADLALSNFNRTDLVAILLQYNNLLYGAGRGGRQSDLLRLNLGVAPKPLAMQNRLGIFGMDTAGWPNGRRPIDDVTDIAVQAVGGPTYVGVGVGDGVSANDDPLPTAFPFLSTPADGRDRQPNLHANP
jgi:Domain of unknown function (DUF4331)